MDKTSANPGKCRGLLCAWLCRSGRARRRFARFGWSTGSSQGSRPAPYGQVRFAAIRRPSGKPEAPFGKLGSGGQERLATCVICRSDENLTLAKGRTRTEFTLSTATHRACLVRRGVRIFSKPGFLRFGTLTADERLSQLRAKVKALSTEGRRDLHTALRLTMETS